MSAPRQLLSAAEPSGDRLAARVLEALGSTQPHRTWHGFSGPAMSRCTNHHSLGDLRALSAAGLVEILPALPRLLAARRTLRDALEGDARLAVFVDAPDLHLPLLRRAQLQGVRTCQLVAPQFWAWRPARRSFLARHVDLTLCLFRFEVERLRSVGAAAHWVGHPASELQSVDRVPAESGDLSIVLAPGSRASEVGRNLPAFVAAARLALRGRSARLRVPWRLPTPPPTIEGVEFSSEEGAELLAEADLALVAPGTATLEAACLGVPQVIAGRMHPLTWAVARRAVGSRWAGLPNLLVGRAAVPEMLQDLSPERLAAPLLPLLDDPVRARSAALEVAGEIKSHLGPPGFGQRVAQFVEPLLDRE